MHGWRESDSFRVPRRPANKSRPMGPAAEVEGRELAKGQVVQHTRGRTQRRGLLSPVLDCVRQAPLGACTFDPRQEPGAVVPHAGIWCAVKATHVREAGPPKSPDR